MGNQKNMANRCGQNSLFKGRLNTKLRGVARGKIVVWTLDFFHRSHKNVQVIVHNGDAKNHNIVLDTGYPSSMICMRGWEIIKCNGSWINAQGVNMGGP